jgi:ADP-ribosyl-[dinitrogen reductase] hydrolase
MDQQDRFRGCLLGLAVGDAVGTSVEFLPRSAFKPLTDMLGGGPFKLKPGQWTDDTSMALCLATSLVEQDGFDPRDQMERYLRWRDQGYLSSTGHCFDIGGTVNRALERFRQTGEPFAGSTDPHSAGNGCIMRLAPIPMFYFGDMQEGEHYAGESSRTTHAATECLDACRLFARITIRALQGKSKDEILLSDRESFQGTSKIVALAQGKYIHKDIKEIRGSGYVVNSLEAALWSFQNSTSFAEAILQAANLGEDADTTAAVCGQLAGAYYGYSNIPKRWVKILSLRDEITRLVDQLFKRTKSQNHE